MSQYLSRFILVLAFLMTSPLHARNIAGIDIPESVNLPDGAGQLILNGAGTRNKFIFKIYAAGLYLPEKATSVEQIRAMPGAKRVHMHFIYDEVEQKKLIKGWKSGFENNLKPGSLAKVSERLNQFNSYFPSVKKDDVINLDFQPGVGTQVWYNGKLQGTVEGEDFYSALLLVWLGKDPADHDLKQAMLGAEND